MTSELSKAKPEVYITLGGERRKLLFNHWARALIQEDKGVDFLSEVDLKTLPIHHTITLVWAGLVDGCPELDGCTPQERRQAQKRVAGWIEELKDLTPLITALYNALINSAPKQTTDGGDKGADKKKEGNQSDENTLG